MARQRKRRLITPVNIAVTPTTDSDSHPGTAQFAVAITNIHGTTLSGGLALGNWETSSAARATVNASGLASTVAQTAEFTGTADAGSTSTVMVDAASTWGTANLAGYTLKITAGTQSGNSRTITSNTGTTITTPAFAGATDATSVYQVYSPRTANINFRTVAGPSCSFDTGAFDATPAVYTIVP